MLSIRKSRMIDSLTWTKNTWFPLFRTDKIPLIFQYFFPFSSIFFQFPQYFFKCLCFKLKTWSILANNTQLIYISLIILNDIYLKCSHFYSILCDFPWLFPDWKMPSHFSRFSSPSGNPETEGATIQFVVCMGVELGNATLVLKGGWICYWFAF